jgi:hypothetical protein
MCPACIATAAVVMAGAISGGGLTALVLKGLRAPTDTSGTEPTNQTGGEPDGSPQSRHTS